jgi:hypothetical protein
MLNLKKLRHDASDPNCTCKKCIDHRAYVAQKAAEAQKLAAPAKTPQAFGGAKRRHANLVRRVAASGILDPVTDADVQRLRKAVESGKNRKISDPEANEDRLIRASRRRDRQLARADVCQKMKGKAGEQGKRIGGGHSKKASDGPKPPKPSKKAKAKK